jgi:phage-related holin
MLDKITFFKWVGAAFGSVVSFIFGGWPEALAYLFLAVALDFLTGILAGGKTGTLKSKITYLGIKRKALIFIIVAVGHMCDRVLGDATNTIAQALDFGGKEFIAKGHVVRDTIIYFYLFNEWLSITENAGKAGLPVPKFLRSMIEVLKPQEEKAEEKTEEK